MGKPPEFALEIASKHTAHNDLVPKRELYAAIGIGEYWRYDPTADSRYYGERLVGELLVGGEYQRLPMAPDAEGRPRGYSPALALDLVWENRILRFFNPATGLWLRDYAETSEELAAVESILAGEQAARAAAESMLASEQAARATERAARAAAEARAAELEAELRRLRGETP